MKSVLLTESKHFWQMLTPTGRLGPSWKTRSICSGPSTSMALNRWMIPDPRVTVYIMLVSSVSSAFQTNPDGVKRCSRGPCRLLPVILINCLESMSCSPPNPTAHALPHLVTFKRSAQAQPSTSLLLNVYHAQR